MIRCCRCGQALSGDVEDEDGDPIYTWLGDDTSRAVCWVGCKGDRTIFGGREDAAILVHGRARVYR